MLKQQFPSREIVCQMVSCYVWFNLFLLESHFSFKPFGKWVGTKLSILFLKLLKIQTFQIVLLYNMKWSKLQHLNKVNNLTLFHNNIFLN